MRKEVLKFRDKISQLVFHDDTLECSKKKIFKRRQIDSIYQLCQRQNHYYSTSELFKRQLELFSKR